MPSTHSLAKRCGTFVQVHQANDRGRDLIVSDVHGCYDSLMRALELAGFDPTQGDRLFSLGDLIDRGPRSWDTLKLIEEPWMHVVRGNHEDMLLSAIDQFESVLHTKADFLPNGGKWLLALTDEQAHDLTSTLGPLLCAQPHVRTILKPNGTDVAFHTAHAELLRARPGSYFDPTQTDDRATQFYTDRELLGLAKGRLPKRWDEGRFIATTTWGRRVVRMRPTDVFFDFPLASGAMDLMASRTPYQRKLSPVFVGHTPVRYLAMHASHIFTDLGCVATFQSTGKDSGRLALIDAQQALEWLELHVQ